MNKNLVEKRAEMDLKSSELVGLTEKASLNSDELGRLKELTAEVKTLTAEVTTLAEAESAAAQIKALSGVAPGIDQSAKKDVAQVSEGGIEFSGGGISEKQWRAIQEPSYRESLRSLFASKTGESGMSDIHRKGLTEGVDTDGGYLVPPDMADYIVGRKAAPTRVHQLVSQFPTNSNVVKFIKDNYTGSDKDIYPNGVRATITGEVPASSTAHAVTGPSFGQKKIDIVTAMLSKEVSMDLVEDSSADVLGYVSDAFNTAVGLLLDYHILRGPGDAMGARGIVTAADTADGVASTATANNDSLVADDIIGLPYKVAEQYIENATWVMNRGSTGATIATMKNSSNGYLFKRGGTIGGLAEKAPDVIEGWPIAWSAFMPDIADAAFPVLFGDLRAYMLAMRRAFSVQVLSGGEDAKKNQVTVLGRLRFGGDVLQPWALRLSKVA